MIRKLGTKTFLQGFQKMTRLLYQKLLPSHTVGSYFAIHFLASRFTIRPSNRTLLNSEKKYAPNASTRFTRRRIPSSNLLVFSMLLGDVVNLCQMYKFPTITIDWRFLKYESMVSIQSESTIQSSLNRLERFTPTTLPA